MPLILLTKQPFGRLFKFLITAYIVLIIPIAVLTIWVNWSLAAPSKDEGKKNFVIAEGESPASFSRRLAEEKIIRNAFVFRVHLKLSGLDRKIQAGSFNLPTNQPAAEIARALTTGRLDKWVTFIEGLRKEEVAGILAKNFKIDEDKFLAKAKEGYLFPDKYLIPVRADEEKILEIFKNNFEKRFSKKLQTEAINQNLTIREVIIIASILERETRGKGEYEREIIAGILLKRWREGMKLAADATIQYALGYSEEEKSWWRKVLTQEDLGIDSPYNTRKYAGLPPGPICSPGLASIKAVIYPKETDYYYYIHDKDGNPHYARTFAEHTTNIQKYLQD